MLIISGCEIYTEYRREKGALNIKRVMRKVRILRKNVIEVDGESSPQSRPGEYRANAGNTNLDKKTMQKRNPISDENKNGLRAK